MIYSWHECAFGDIAQLKIIYILNELSVRKSLNLVRVLTVMKTGTMMKGIYSSSPHAIIQ